MASFVLILYVCLSLITSLVHTACHKVDQSVGFLVRWSQGMQLTNPTAAMSAMEFWTGIFSQTKPRLSELGSDTREKKKLPFFKAEIVTMRSSLSCDHCR